MREPPEEGVSNRNADSEERERLAAGGGTEECDIVGFPNNGSDRTSLQRVSIGMT